MRNLLILLSIVLSACQPSPEAFFQGYVEGEWVYLAAPSAGYLEKINISRGARPLAGSPAFSLSGNPESFNVQLAQAKVAAAEAAVSNLSAPRRAAEIATLAAQLHAAEAALQLSTAQWQQNQTLAESHFIAAAKLDETRAAKARDSAQVEAARQQLINAQNALGRRAELQQATAELQAARAALAQSHWQQSSKTVLIPTTGQITDVFYHPGEWVAAGQPVASLLPDKQRLIRFFVPETQLAQLKIGQSITANCDECATPITATINFIAAQAEYTPPIIYSQGTREKLVFRVQATPSPADATNLPPGLPLEIRLTGIGK